MAAPGPAGRLRYRAIGPSGLTRGLSLREGQMASKTERTIINAAGLAQGIVLVTFPAASTIFTDTSEYGLSSTPSTGPCSCLRSRWPCHKIAIDPATQLRSAPAAAQ